MSHWYIVLCGVDNVKLRLHSVHYAASERAARLEALSYWASRVKDTVAIVTCDRLPKFSDTE